MKMENKVFWKEIKKDAKIHNKIVKEMKKREKKCLQSKNS